MDSEKTHYLTKEGFERLQKEYHELKALKMAKIEGVETPHIMQSEDLNPEYISFVEDLSLLEARLTDLDHILSNAELLSVPQKEDQERINLGAYVLVENGGKNEEFQILSSLEADPIAGRISDESLVGKMLLGKKVGEEVRVSRTIYKVKNIRYSV